jgi:hypothetical protein
MALAKTRRIHVVFLLTLLTVSISIMLMLVSGNPNHPPRAASDSAMQLATSRSVTTTKPIPKLNASIERPKLGEVELDKSQNQQLAKMLWTYRKADGTTASFTALLKFYSTGIMGGTLTRDVVHDHGSWENRFVYSGWNSPYQAFRQGLQMWGIADGARAVVKGTQRVLAEARLIAPPGPPYTIDGLEVEEFHYGPSGDLVFYCKSKFELHGIKKSESDSQGTRSNDYFPYWAVNDH